MIKQFRDSYRWLSNFQPVKIELRGRIYTSVEHAYMSEKSDDEEWKDYCANKKTRAVDVKHKSKEIELRGDWGNVKLLVMEYCLHKKFSQEPFKAMLLETGNQNIQEGNMWNDKFWGICLKTNEGENHLGRLIMDIRKGLS